MENLLDKIKVGDKVRSELYGIGEIIGINVNSNYSIKVSYYDNINIVTYTEQGYCWLSRTGDKIELIEEQTEEVKEIPINLNNLSLSELKNLKQDIEKKISEAENRYVDTKRDKEIYCFVNVLENNDSNLHHKAFWLNQAYKWELVKDNLGQLCLLPTKPVK